MEQKDIANKSDTVSFGFYMVALFDILGQRKALKSFDDLPKNEKEREKFIKTIKQTFGAVDGIRKWFQSFYDTFSRAQYADGNLNKEQIREFEKLKKTEIKFQYFGDTIIMYASLAEDQEHIPVNDVYATIIASGTTILCSLAAKNPLRGSIEIGIGAEMHNGEIYGSCLNDAVSLESEIAQYPRIVIGQQLISYLKELCNRKADDLTTSYKKGLANACLQMLIQDVDGYFIVDYLGKYFKEIINKAGLDHDLISKSFEFVDAQTKEWQQKLNTKLAFRYNLLRQYFAVKFSD